MRLNGGDWSTTTNFRLTTTDQVNEQPATARPYNARLLRNRLFALSRNWLATAWALKILAFLLGAISVSLSIFPKASPFVTAGLILLAELCLWRSDRLKSLAQTLHRKLDMEDSFGWKISAAEMSDVLARSPFDLNSLARQDDMGSNYWASKETPGSKRAVENVQESAWWSKHLAESMWLVCLAWPCILLIGSVSLLIFSIQTFQDADQLSNAAKIVTSAILLIFSLGFIRFTVGYFSFSKKSERIEEAATAMLKSATIDNVEAIKLWQEYQLARSTAPMLPTWIWKRRQVKLNLLWNQYRC